MAEIRMLRGALPPAGGLPVHIGNQERLCCSEPQLMLLGNYVLYLLTCILMWRSRSLRPLKLFTVFLHELGHAVAVWVTCGSVQGIEVHADHGGLTHWSHHAHRIRCASQLVLPAGYLGSATWGGVILVCCARSATAHAVAMVLIVFLVVALVYSLFGKNERRGDWTLPYLCVGMLVVLVGMLFLHHSTGWPIWDLLLTKTLLLVGTMNTLFATYDIWEDCVLRSCERSDACRYAELLGFPCATGRCVGAVWLVVSMSSAVAALLLALRWVPPAPLVRGLGDLHFSSFLFLLLPSAALAAAAAERWPTLTAALTAASSGRLRVRPWASAPHIAPSGLQDVLLENWRGIDGVSGEHRAGRRACEAAAAGGADVALREWRRGEHEQEGEEEEALFFSDCDEGDLT